MDLIIIFCAKYLFLVPIFVYLIFLVKITIYTRQSILKLSLIAFPLSILTAKTISRFFFNARPFALESVKPLFAHVPDNGFPSDHTLLTATIAVVVFVYNKNLGIILFVISLIVGFSRVISKIHHTIDILGSCAIATLAVVVALIAVNKIKAIKNFSLPFINR